MKEKINKQDLIRQLQYVYDTIGYVPSLNSLSRFANAPSVGSIYRHFESYKEFRSAAGLIDKPRKKPPRCKSCKIVRERTSDALVYLNEEGNCSVCEKRKANFIPREKCSHCTKKLPQTWQYQSRYGAMCKECDIELGRQVMQNSYQPLTEPIHSFTQKQECPQCFGIDPNKKDEKELCKDCKLDYGCKYIWEI